jgi:hypothetical protein
MLARFELFNDQTFYQNNRQDLNQSLCIYKVGNPIVEFSGFYIEVID